MLSLAPRPSGHSKGRVQGDNTLRQAKGAHPATGRQGKMTLLASPRSRHL